MVFNFIELLEELRVSLTFIRVFLSQVPYSLEHRLILWIKLRRASRGILGVIAPWASWLWWRA